MRPSNPYQSPNSPSPERSDIAAVNSTRLPYGWTVCLLIAGGFCMLLLNGQIFTNALAWLACLTISAALWLPHMFAANNQPYRRLAMYVVLAHTVLIIAVAAGLPTRFQRQQQFNQTVEELRQRGATRNP